MKKRFNLIVPIDIEITDDASPSEADNAMLAIKSDVDNVRGIEYREYKNPFGHDVKVIPHRAQIIEPAGERVED